jgi:formiminotetrahydrofolate cyclodeaminase
MAAALGSMVCRLAKLEGDCEVERKFFTEAVDRDAAAFREVMAAYKRPKTERQPFVEKALQIATLVPLEVYEAAAGLKARLSALNVPAKFASDLETGFALADAARAGALANVRINLDAIQDEAFKERVAARIA